MYLESILENYQELNTFKSGATTYAPAYRYWRNILFSFMMKIFTINIADIPQKEILTRNFLKGYSGVVRSKHSGKLIAVDPSLYGMTEYYDIFTDFNYSTPFESDHVEIGKNGVLIENDTLRNGAYYIIDHYSKILAHLDVTLVNIFINSRESQTIIANTQKAADSARTYRTRIYRGAPDVIVDKSFVGLEFKDNSTASKLGVMELIDCKNNIVSQFYEDIGVKRTNEKRERLITDEVSANNVLLRLNIKDMHDCLIKGCEDVKNVFGVDASVVCNVDYTGDGQPENEEAKNDIE